MHATNKLGQVTRLEQIVDFEEFLQETDAQLVPCVGLVAEMGL